MRPAIRAVRRRFEDIEIVGAEIGVLKGRNAKDMLDNLPNLNLLYLIDPYEQYEEWIDSNFDKIFEAKKEALETLEPHSKRIRWIMKKTEDSIGDIQPNSLHFIYIDGNHVYDYVKKDLEIASKWVMCRGIIGGHDFAPGKRGVIRAVLEFCKEKNVTFSIKRRDWWFTKNWKN